MAEYEDDDRRDARDDDRSDGDRGDVVAAAKSKVMGPAIGLIVTGALSVLLCLLMMASTGGLPQAFDAERKKVDTNPEMNAQQKQQMRDFLDTYEKILNVGMIPGSALGALGGLLTLLGGVKLMGLKSAGLVKFSAVLAMIPCTGVLCCPLGLPVGVWAFLVLGKPEVKAGYLAVAQSR